MADIRLWALTAHCCRVCFGRVLEHHGEDGARTYRCSNCGTEAEGKTPATICTCGIKLRTGTDAGVRCIANDARTPEVPSEIVAEQCAAMAQMR